MCKQPFTTPFSATDQPGVPLYSGTTYNLLANLVAQIRNAHPAPSIYGEDGMGLFSHGVYTRSNRREVRCGTHKLSLGQALKRSVFWLH